MSRRKPIILHQDGYSMTDIAHDIYFVTKVVNRRVELFTPDNGTLDLFIQNLNYYRRKFKFAIYGYVIIPDHYHIIIDSFQRVSIKRIKEDMNKNIARQIVQQFLKEKNTVLNRFSIRPRYRCMSAPHRYRNSWPPSLCNFLLNLIQFLMTLYSVQSKT